MQLRLTKYARIGESVMLLQAMQFIRVGYPMTIADISLDTELLQRRDGMVEVAAAAMFPAAKSVAWLPASWVGSGKAVEIDQRIRIYLEKAANIAILIEKGFGGKERKVYEETMVDYWGKFDPRRVPWKVIGKRFVKTGTRYSGHGSYSSYSGEYDYEPAGLADEETHCVYSLEYDEPGSTFTLKSFSTLARNTQRIVDDEVRL